VDEQHLKHHHRHHHHYYPYIIIITSSLHHWHWRRQTSTLSSKYRLIRLDYHTTKTATSNTHIQWRSQKLCVGSRPERQREDRGACAEWGGVWVGVSPPQPTRGSARASWAPSVGSGAKPQRQIHFCIFLGHRTLLVKRKMWLWCSMNYWYNNNLCRCPVLGGNGRVCPPPGYATVHINNIQTYKSVIKSSGTQWRDCPTEFVVIGPKTHPRMLWPLLSNSENDGR